jgi:hypothetical protein
VWRSWVPSGIHGTAGRGIDVLAMPKPEDKYILGYGLQAHGRR